MIRHNGFLSVSRHLNYRSDLRGRNDTLSSPKKFRIASNGWKKDGTGFPPPQASKDDIVGVVLPLIGGIALLAVAGPYLGSSLGLVIIVTAIAAVTGILDGIARATGTSVPITAGIISLVLLIPAFLKLAVFGGIGYLAFNFVAGILGIGERSEEQQEIDPRNVTIDVEYESIDD